MKNKDYLITAFPSTPKTERIGILTWPYLINLIGQALNVETVYAVNVFNSFKNHSKETVEQYLEFLKQNGVDLNEIYFDCEHLDKIKEIITKMYQTDLIKKEKQTIYKCDCGKVEGIITELNLQNQNAKLYSIVNGKPVCNFCHSECQAFEKEVLVVPIDAEKKQEINIVPNCFKAHFQDLYEKFNNQCFVISKSRETGIEVCLDGENFNIDVDFTWMLFSSLLPDKNKIIIAGNKHIFKMLKAHYVNSVLQQKPIIFLATSYNAKNPDFDETKAFYEISDNYYKKLFLLYHQRWNNHSQPRLWDKSIYKFLKNLSETDRKNMYEAIINTETSNACSMEEKLDLLVKNINMSKNNKERKIGKNKL